MFSLLAISCSNNATYIGEGELITKEIALNNFKTVKTHGSFRVNITKGTTQKVEIIGHSNILDRLETQVYYEELNIQLLEGSYSNIDITVNITIPTLNKASLSGSGDIYIYDSSSDETTFLEIFGSGNIEVYKNDGCKNMNATIDGSGSINMHQQFTDIENLILKIKGSGSYFGFKNSVENATINIKGSGNCNTTVSQLIKANINGSGNINYKGNPNIESEISGSGKIRNLN